MPCLLPSPGPGENHRKHETHGVLQTVKYCDEELKSIINTTHAFPLQSMLSTVVIALYILTLNLDYITITCFTHKETEAREAK